LSLFGLHVPSKLQGRSPTRVEALASEKPLLPPPSRTFRPPQHFLSTGKNKTVWVLRSLFIPPLLGVLPSFLKVSIVLPLFDSLGRRVPRLFFPGLRPALRHPPWKVVPLLPFIVPPSFSPRSAPRWKIDFAGEFLGEIFETQDEPFFPLFFSRDLRFIISPVILQLMTRQFVMARLLRQKSPSVPFTGGPPPSPGIFPPTGVG